MTIYYVDPGGAAGTGDGTSFANRAQCPSQINAGQSYSSYGNYYIPDGNHELRFIKNPDPWTISNVSTKKTPRIWNSGYGMPSIGNSYNDITFSTTKGESIFQMTTHGCRTGDWIEIINTNWYYNDANYGDPNATNAQGGNRVPISGIWKVTVVDSNKLKLDGFTAPFNKPAGTQWTNGGSYPVSASGGQWRNVTSEVLECSAALPIKHLLPHRDIKQWTAHNNASTYDTRYEFSAWSSNNLLSKPNATNRINIPTSSSVGKVAHIELDSTLDLSAFQGISYELAWQQGHTKTRTDNENDDGSDDTDTGSGRYSLRLCTDTSGDTSVHTIPISTKQCLGTQKRGTNIFNTGGNMNSAIKSIAIYKDTTTNDENSTFAITDLIAYKTSGQILNHRSNFGFDTAGDRQFYCAQYFHNDSTEGIYAIKLCPSQRYYDNMYSNISYYGSTGNWWSQDYTNQTLKVMQPFSYGRANSTTNYNMSNSYNFNDSQNRGDDFYTAFGYAPQMFGSGPSTNNNIPTGWKKVSGGWNRTDMSSRADDDDKTFFDPGWCGNHGFYPSWGGSSVEFTNIHTCRGYGMRFEGQYGIFSKLYGILNRGITFSHSHTQFLDIFMSCYNQNTIHSSNSQDYQNNGSHTYGNKWKIHAHGNSGQETCELNGFKTDFSEINVEGNYYSYLARNDTYASGNITIDNVYAGWDGRDQSAGRFTISGYDSNGSVTITNMYQVYGYLDINNNNQRVNVDTYTHKIAPSYADALVTNGTLSATQKYKVMSNNQPNYSINNSSQKFVLGSATVERRFYVSVPMKINNVTNTDTDPHQLSNSTAYILSANDGGVSGAGKYYGYNWTMEPETSIVQGGSGKSWKITKTHANGVASHTIGKIAVAAGGTVTVKIWMYRPNGGTTSYGELRIPSDATLGISTNSIANNTTSSANTWQEVTVTASPTSAGIMDVEIETKTDTNTNTGVCYFDNMTVEQS